MKILNRKNKIYIWLLNYFKKFLKLIYFYAKLRYRNFYINKEILFKFPFLNYIEYFGFKMIMIPRILIYENTVSRIIINFKKYII